MSCTIDVVHLSNRTATTHSSTLHSSLRLNCTSSLRVLNLQTRCLRQCWRVESDGFLPALILLSSALMPHKPRTSVLSLFCRQLLA